MFTNIFILWITSLPFVTWGGIYEIPKVLFFLVGGFGLALFWIFKILIKRENIIFSKADIFYFLWLVALLAGSIFGIHPYESIIGGSYRHQGVIFFFVLWLTGKTIFMLGDNQKKLLGKVFAFGIILQSLVIFYQMITGHTYFGKPLGTLGETNAVAGFLAIGSVFVFENMPLILIFLPIASIFFTESRSGISSMIISGGMVFKSLRRRIQKMIFILIIACGAILVILLSGVKEISFYENRLLFWKIGIDQIFQRPILGYGAESGEELYKNAFGKNGIHLNNFAIDRSHNLFIDIAMWSGFLGLGSFAAFLFFSYKNIRNKNSKFAFWAFILYSLFQPLSIVHWILLVLIL